MVFGPFLLHLALLFGPLDPNVGSRSCGVLYKYNTPRDFEPLFLLRQCIIVLQEKVDYFFLSDSCPVDTPQQSISRDKAYKKFNFQTVHVAINSIHLKVNPPNSPYLTQLSNATNWEFCFTPGVESDCARTDAGRRDGPDVAICKCIFQKTLFLSAAPGASRGLALVPRISFFPHVPMPVPFIRRALAGGRIITGPLSVCRFSY